MGGGRSRRALTSWVTPLLWLFIAGACTGTVRTKSGGPSPGDDAGSFGGRGGDGDGDGPGGDGDGDGDGSGGSAGSDPDAPFLASSSQARRHSRSELDHVLRDLLGDEENAASRLLPEDPYSPYDNDYTAQTVSAALIDSYAALADDVAARVVGSAELRGQLLPCEPSGPDDRACFRQTADRLTRRAFRRQLSDAELEPYLGLLDFATEDNPDVDNDFDTALELLLRAVLMDPELLYRVEIGEPTADDGVRALSGTEIATRMSFLLWGTLPDEALLDDAEAGRLAMPEGRSEALTRMLEDPRARDQLHRFHAMWLGYRVIPHAAELAAAFDRETTALLDRVIFDEPQSYANLFTFGETYIDALLAEHYGLPAPSSGSDWVEYGDSGRAGLLSHGAVLSAFGKFSDTSPTQRGIFIRTRLLCEELRPPPPDVMADQPPGDMDAVCKWDRYEQHRTSDACSGCHAQTDPIGFGLERYDLAGRYREHDDGLPQCAIEGVGAVLPYGEFSGPAELGQLLVDSGVLERCVVEQLMQFALGRPLEANEGQLVDELTQAFTAGDTELVALLTAIVASDAFALRKEPAP